MPSAKKKITKKIKKTPVKAVSVKKPSAGKVVSVKKPSAAKVVSVKKPSAAKAVSVKKPSSAKAVSVKKPSAAKAVSVKKPPAGKVVSVKKPSAAKALSVKKPSHREQQKLKQPKIQPLKKVKDIKKPEPGVFKESASSVQVSSEKTKKLTKKQARLLDEHEKKWNELYKRARGISPVEFKVSSSFEAKSPLNHPQFGWGWVLKNTNHRLEVIFKDKVRLLLSGQMPLKGSEKPG